MKRICFLLATALVVLCPAAVRAAAVTTAEYFIDSDPGPGQGTVIEAGSPNTLGAFVIDLPPSVVAELSPGPHTLVARARDDRNNWSIAFARTFFKHAPGSVDPRPLTVRIHPIAPNPRHEPISSILIQFDQPVVGFDLTDLSLTRGNGPNLLTQMQTLLTTDDATFVLQGLAELTSSEGSYTLTLQGANSGIIGESGAALASNDSISWLVDVTPPSMEIVSVTSNGLEPVDSITMVFSESVTGFELADLSLSRNGGPNLLTALQALNTLDHSTFVLSGLAALTGRDGVYSLTLRAPNAFIYDRAGNSFTQDRARSWTVDNTFPKATIAAILPNPRNAPVSQLEISFTEPVTGFDLSDLVLVRNAGSNLLGPGQSLRSIDARRFRLEGLAALSASDGTYTILLRSAGSGIGDSSGNPLLADAFQTWAIDSYPISVAITPITPDPRNNHVEQISFFFSKPITGFTAEDLVLARNGGPNLLTGTVSLGTLDSQQFTLAGLQSLTAPEGSYQLTLRAANSGIQDLIGNSLAADVSLGWRVDRTPPAVQIALNGDAATITFSEPVFGFDLADLSLVKESGVDLLTGLELLTQVGHTQFLLHGLAVLTTQPGSYTLTLRPLESGIIDAASNPLGAGANASKVVPLPPETSTAAAEYFIDVDPGPGQGTPIVVGGNSWPLAVTAEIPASVIANLSDGPHFLACRMRDSAGRWSIAFTRSFQKANPASDPIPIVASVAIQWFLEGQPVTQPAFLPAVPSAREVSLVLQASLQGLTTRGSYQLLATPIDSHGRAGFGASRYLFLDPSAFTRYLHLNSLRRIDANRLRLNFSIDPGSAYTLQSSSDLVTWIDLPPLDGNGNLELPMPSSPRQFFRLLSY